MARPIGWFELLWCNQIAKSETAAVWAASPMTLWFSASLGFCTRADLPAVDSSSVFRVARFRVFDFGVTSSSMLLTPPIAISASPPRPHERVGTS